MITTTTTTEEQLRQTMHTICNEHWPLITSLIATRVRSAAERSMKAYVPHEIEELIDDACCQIVDVMPQVISEETEKPRTNKEIARLSTYCAAHRVMHRCRFVSFGKDPIIDRSIDVDGLLDPKFTRHDYQGPNIDELLDVLSHNHLTVGVCLALGLNQLQTADRLHLSRWTIANRMRDIRRQLTKAFEEFATRENTKDSVSTSNQSTAQV